MENRCGICCADGPAVHRVFFHFVVCRKRCGAGQDRIVGVSHGGRCTIHRDDPGPADDDHTRDCHCADDSRDPANVIGRTSRIDGGARTWAGNGGKHSGHSRTRDRSDTRDHIFAPSTRRCTNRRRDHRDPSTNHSNTSHRHSTPRHAAGAKCHRYSSGRFARDGDQEATKSANPGKRANAGRVFPVHNPNPLHRHSTLNGLPGPSFRMRCHHSHSRNRWFVHLCPGKRRLSHLCRCLGSTR
ncbi:MAG: hypothetical protein BWY83_00882 [bacterium ADurb.Bin478]|nr:MAG: hypothetical protein BWY83_00882 [bacterium ADurb.Bin478]